MASFPNSIFSQTNPTASSPRVAPTSPSTEVSNLNNEVSAIETWLGANGAALAALVLTLTNKRYIPRVLLITNNPTAPAYNVSNYDYIHITGQSNALNFTTGLTWTSGAAPQDGEGLVISVTGTTTVGFTWGSLFESSGTVTLPAGTTGTAKLTMGFMWNTETSKYRIDGFS